MNSAMLSTSPATVASLMCQEWMNCAPTGRTPTRGCSFMEFTPAVGTDRWSSEAPAPDTDVAVISVHYASHFHQLLFATGVKSAITAICHLYGSSYTDLNKARHQLFCTRSGNDQTIPPTMDALKQHHMRANFQAAVWKRAHVPIVTPPSPTEHGWILDKEEKELSIVWMVQQYVPPELLQLEKCGCTTGCEGRRCACKAANLPCTDMCRCDGCGNQLVGRDRDAPRLEDYEADTESDV